jgi:hypothetical protein
MCHASGADTALQAKPSENLRRYISGTKSKTVRNLFELSVPQSRADDELRAVVEVAESRDLCVVCCARSPTSVVRALKYGTNIINLANYADGEALDALEAAKDRAVVIPAIAWWEPAVGTGYLILLAHLPRAAWELRLSIPYRSCWAGAYI